MLIRILESMLFTQRRKANTIYMSLVITSQWLQHEMFLIINILNVYDKSINQQRQQPKAMSSHGDINYSHWDGQVADSGATVEISLS